MHDLVDKEANEIRRVYNFPTSFVLGTSLRLQWRASRPTTGEIRCKEKFEDNEEAKLYKQLKIEKQRSWQEKVDKGIEYLKTQDPKLFKAGHRYTKPQRAERKKIILTLCDTQELNFPQATMAINEWAGKTVIDVASVGY